MIELCLDSCTKLTSSTASTATVNSACDGGHPRRPEPFERSGRVPFGSAGRVLRARRQTMSVPQDMTGLGSARSIRLVWPFWEGLDGPDGSCQGVRMAIRPCENSMRGSVWSRREPILAIIGISFTPVKLISSSGRDRQSNCKARARPQSPAGRACGTATREHLSVAG